MGAEDVKVVDEEVQDRAGHRGRVEGKLCCPRGRGGGAVLTPQELSHTDLVNGGTF